MKKILAVLAAAAAAAVMTACSSIEAATTFNNQKITSDFSTEMVPTRTGCFLS